MKKLKCKSRHRDWERRLRALMTSMAMGAKHKMEDIPVITRIY